VPDKGRLKPLASVAAPLGLPTLELPLSCFGAGMPSGLSMILAIIRSEPELSIFVGSLHHIAELLARPSIQTTLFVPPIPPSY
jgi:hypothetical protein